MAANTSFGTVISLFGNPQLSSILLTGNATGGTNLVVSDGDRVSGEDNPAGSGFDLQLTGGDAGGGGPSDGGDVVISPGTGVGGGSDGTVVIQGDLQVTGGFSLPGFYSGLGTPEGVQVANVGDLYRRLDGSTGNALYIKMVNPGLATGWVPAGPAVAEYQSSVGGAVFNTVRPFFRNLAFGYDISVFRNGLLQRVGPAPNEFQVTGASQITFNSPLPFGEPVTISYLPL